MTRFYLQFNLFDDLFCCCCCCSWFDLWLLLTIECQHPAVLTLCAYFDQINVNATHPWQVYGSRRHLFSYKLHLVVDGGGDVILLHSNQPTRAFFIPFTYLPGVLSVPMKKFFQLEAINSIMSLNCTMIVCLLLRHFIYFLFFLVFVFILCNCEILNLIISGLVSFIYQPSVTTHNVSI